MRGSKEEGFSLVEVLIALGILAGVLISIAGLFVLGGKSVKSGRTASEALAAGREIVEEMGNWPMAQLWTNFGFDGQATTYTVDTSTCVTADCTSWQGTLTSKLGPTAHATIKVESLAQGVTLPSNFADADGIAITHNVRVTISVLWTQVTGRARTIAVVTTRN